MPRKSNVQRSSQRVREPDVSSPTRDVRIFGIRHHGPGSAYALRHALKELKPDALLVEGPPDAHSVLPLLNEQGMKPPVALVIYAASEPHHAVYYLFAVFSAEWQALQYGLQHNIETRFFDLPQRHQLALLTPQSPQTLAEQETPSTELPDDPLTELARAAGYDDGERWWEKLVEERLHAHEVFGAILEAMTVLRDANFAMRESQAPPISNRAWVEDLREAYMREAIRSARREGWKRIAVVCGAWHAPALLKWQSEEDDAARLRSLATIETQATWAPWTYGRLALASGYGAGIMSPGWYHHLWEMRVAKKSPREVATRWLIRVAHLLREEDLDASSAHVIEATRLAETLAALRGRVLPGLDELTEATRAVFCLDTDAPLQLIERKLIVSERLGAVPETTPMPPLQRDLAAEQKRLRLAPDASQHALDLDLRQRLDLERSYFLHRLNLLGIPWGETKHAHRAKGTFHELWRLEWQPEFVVRLLEAGMWGNTIHDAASARARDTASRATELPKLTTLLDAVILAALPEAVSEIMSRVREHAALASDVAHLMEALPPLANIQRYGNVRQTDTTMVAEVTDGLIARICIGLPLACAALNDEAAAQMFQHLLNTHQAIALLQSNEQRDTWRATLKQLADQRNLHGLLAGRACRLLLEEDVFVAEDAAQRMSLALSTANDPAPAAAWLEGFLKGSGLLLLHDENLWNVVDGWLTQLTTDHFTAIVPLLRRTFATFAAPERRQMGERVKKGQTVGQANGRVRQDNFDSERAEKVLPLLAQCLGLKFPETVETINSNV